jgi:hypothetical protein
MPRSSKAKICGGRQTQNNCQQTLMSMLFYVKLLSKQHEGLTCPKTDNRLMIGSNTLACEPAIILRTQYSMKKKL